MNKPVILTVLAGGALAAGIGLAAPAAAQPTMNFNCAPCAPGSTTPIWNQITSMGPWEGIMDSTNGVVGDNNGAWESGVTAVNGGAWEKVFPAG